MGELVYLLHNSVKQPPIRFEVLYLLVTIKIQKTTDPPILNYLYFSVHRLTDLFGQICSTPVGILEISHFLNPIGAYYIRGCPNVITAFSGGGTVSLIGAPLN